MEWPLHNGKERKTEIRATPVSVLRALRTRTHVPRHAKYSSASHSIWEQSENKEHQPCSLPSPCCPGCSPAPGSGWCMRQEPGKAWSSWEVLEASLWAPSYCSALETFRFQDCLPCKGVGTGTTTGVSWPKGFPSSLERSVAVAQISVLPKKGSFL